MWTIGSVVEFRLCILWLLVRSPVVKITVYIHIYIYIYRVRSKQLSSVSVCRMQVFTEFSGHDNSACLLHLYLDVLWDGGWGVSGCTATFLWGAVSRICSKQHTTSLISSHQATSQDALLKSSWCSYTVVLTWLPLASNSNKVYSANYGNNKT